MRRAVFRKSGDELVARRNKRSRRRGSSLTAGDAGECGLQTVGGAVAGALAFDVGHVEGLGALDCEHIAGVVQVLAAAPAELLHDDILGRGQPR